MKQDESAAKKESEALSVPLFDSDKGPAILEAALNAVFDCVNACKRSGTCDQTCCLAEACKTFFFRLQVPRLARMHASDLEDISQASAGDIVAMFGVECASGDTFTDGSVRYTTCVLML